MRAILESSTMCCGVVEVDGLNDKGRWNAEGFLKLLIKNHVNDFYEGEDAEADPIRFLCQVLFTVAYGKEYPKAHAARMDALKKYIEDNNIGSFVITEARVNRGSGNRVKAGIWTPVTGRLVEWTKARGIKKERDCFRYLWSL